MVIVTQAWHRQPYYTILVNMSIVDPILLPTQKDLLSRWGGGGSDKQWDTEISGLEFQAKQRNA